MKERSITNRNLLGGFSGGFLGILTCALLYPFLLPAGCFVGVIVGYWYQEIFQAFVNSLYKAAIVCCKGRRDLKLKVEAWKLFFTSKKIFLLEMREKVLSIYSFFSKQRKYFGNFLNVKASPFIKWLRAHPMNRANMFALVSLLVFVLVNFLWLVPSLAWVWANIKTSVPGSDSPMPFLSLMLFVALLALFIMTIAFCLPHERLRDYYRDFEVYSNKGILWFMFYKLIMLLFVELVFLFSFALLLLYFVGVGALLVIFVSFPIVVALLFLRAVYEIAMRKGHLLCFGVTLITTSIFAWQSYSHLNNQVVLWSVALTAGCVSGILTEAIRGVIAGLFERGKLLRIVKAEASSLLAPSWRYFLDFPSWVSWKMPSLPGM